MSSDFARKLRRLKPGKHRHELKPRKDSELAFLGVGSEVSRTLLYDTTVYIDILQGRFPAEGEAMLLAADAWHSTVTEMELATLAGLLDPADTRTRTVVRVIAEVIDRRPAHRTITPDREIWHEAGILSGMIARLQRLDQAGRKRIVNDALIFATARKFGHTVLTRNIADFDLLQQLNPSTRVLFYRT